MTAFLTGSSAPSSAITTTTETLAINIPATALTPPPNATAVIIRGRININTGTTVTGLAIKLRAGQNNTTTAQVDTGITLDAGASGTFGGEFEFQDASLANLGTGGYSITVTQNGAGTNGTLLNVEYEVDYAVP